jgi:hypothetical protein
MKQEQFKTLTSEQQWKWVVDNKEMIEQVDLDNDGTWVSLKGSDDECLTMKAYLGWDDGVQHLLTAIGIPNSPV